MHAKCGLLIPISKSQKVGVPKGLEVAVKLEITSFIIFSKSVESVSEGNLGDDQDQEEGFHVSYDFKNHAHQPPNALWRPQEVNKFEPNQDRSKGIEESKEVSCKLWVTDLENWGNVTQGLNSDYYNENKRQSVNVVPEIKEIVPSFPLELDKLKIE